MKTILFSRINIILLVSIFVSVISCNNQDPFESSNQTNRTDNSGNIIIIKDNGVFTELSESILVGTDYTFNNSGAPNGLEADGNDHPALINFNQVSNEIIIADRKTSRLVSFSPEGKFIRTIGGPGQGPGEFIRLSYYSIDNSGNILTYDYANQRMSIFDKKGEFNSDFRLTAARDTRFSFDPNNLIIANMPANDHYFTLINYDGEIIDKIAPIPQFNEKYNQVNINHAIGWPFINAKGEYVIFLKHMNIIKTFNSKGILLNEYHLNITLFEEKMQYFIRPESNPGNQATLFIFDVVYYGNSYYMMTTKLIDKKYEFYIYKFNDSNFEVEDILLLKSPNLGHFTEYTDMRGPTMSFDIFDENTILFTGKKTGEIYIYNK